MTPQRVTLITLGVTDLARSRAFYADLGWEEVAGEGENIAFYRLDGAALGLFGRAALAEDQNREEAELGTGAMTLAQNYPDQASVDAAFTRAVAAGARPLKQPQEVFWGGYSGYFADPDGHVWEIAHNPFWSLDATGRLTIPDPA